MMKNTEQWHRKLDERAAELESELRTAKADEAEAPTRTPHVQVPDTVDAAEERLRGALRNAEMDRDVSELRDIEAARERLRTGEFGTCVDCGTEIPVERLDALPASARCVECQQLYERTHPIEIRLPPAL
ncbi:TraR/DksA family transcriptional regulator [Variovorax paradoxus]|jgi:DnaK suppressor protein|uniref:TraR/DksA family transcriptional regulator n=1 Tax=Variovorax paradoxus TaxID=34073 RepID=UPI0024811471|nr:TraR/DksA C4-type zinc finger protein [Variovorax paradoxus]WGT62613.1 TraR/DksA C4-type zinc finger protein [Variovorax paradoxus]